MEKRGSLKNKLLHDLLTPTRLPHQRTQQINSSFRDVLPCPLNSFNMLTLPPWMRNLLSLTVKQKYQPQPSHVVHAGPNLENMDLETTDAFTQQKPEQMDEEFTTTAYPNV
ncbi:hypothetical protein Tco_1006672 [Tanacetum coccineum]|uniref:Uncharacterized protein n=1 Tax=Tanacetum coccineum TaxID=301880 RepID=A0ABQ5FJH2_9ASTR